MPTKAKKTTKKTAKKTAVKKKTKKSNNHRLTAKDIEFFKQLLLEKRNEILGNVNEMELEALKKSRLDATGNLSSMPIHMADLGSDNFEQEFALGLMDSERKILREIDQAFERIDNGTYGICLGLKKRISKARLEAQPWAKYCIEYAEMIEKGLAEEKQ